jgi:hypothetical protein
MPYKGQANRTQSNTVGRVIVRDTTPPKSTIQASGYKREDSYRDLKKVTKKQN